jgi:hypothetical protein
MKTLGEFYREKILTHKPLVTKKLPENSDTINIERDLFGWKLYSGKTFIECRSEDEARYLKIFLEAGLAKVRVPKNDNYLKTILPELETLKSKIDRIINSYAESILDAKIRKRLKEEVWSEISK